MGGQGNKRNVNAQDLSEVAGDPPRPCCLCTAGERASTHNLFAHFGFCAAS